MTCHKLNGNRTRNGLVSTALFCKRDRWFESGSLQRRVHCEPDFLGAWGCPTSARLPITAGNGKDPGAQDVGKQMDDPVRIALVGDYPSELVGDTEAPLRLGEEHHPAIRRDPSAVEGGLRHRVRARLTMLCRNTDGWRDGAPNAALTVAASVFSWRRGSPEAGEELVVRM